MAASINKIKFVEKRDSLGKKSLIAVSQILFSPSQIYLTTVYQTLSIRPMVYVERSVSETLDLGRWVICT